MLNDLADQTLSDTLDVTYWALEPLGNFSSKSLYYILAGELGPIEMIELWTTPLPPWINFSFGSLCIDCLPVTKF